MAFGLLLRGLKNKIKPIEKIPLFNSGTSNIDNCVLYGRHWYIGCRQNFLSQRNTFNCCHKNSLIHT